VKKSTPVKRVRKPKPATAEVADAPAPEGLLKPWTRWGLTALLVMNGLVALAYRGLFLANLEQTSALFIGLPLTIGILIINLSRTKSTYGAVLRGNLIFLCVTAPLLGEGSLCLLMAAPIFIAVSLAVVAASKAAGNSAAWLLALSLPLLLGAFERQANLKGDNVQTVQSSLIRPGRVQDWVGRTRLATKPASTDSRYLKLGFPMPLSYSITDGLATVQFSEAEGVKGAWSARVLPKARGTRFEILKDESKLSHWVRFIDSEVEIFEAGPGMVRIEQNTRFQPLLHPLWYFVPAERYAISQMHTMTADTWNPAQ
jgi:hypothetical protein